MKHQSELSSAAGQGSQSRVSERGVGVPQIHYVWLGEEKVNFGKMARKLYCGALRSAGRVWARPLGVLWSELVVRAGRVQWARGQASRAQRSARGCCLPRKLRGAGQ